jgi:hypothetical protein
MAEDLTQEQLTAVAEDMRARIVAGEFTEALHQEIAPMLVNNAGEIVRKGVAQNTKAVVVSPWTLVKWTARSVQTVAYYAFVLRARAASARAAKQAAEAPTPA